MKNKIKINGKALEDLASRFIIGYKKPKKEEKRLIEQLEFARKLIKEDLEMLEIHKKDLREIEIALFKYRDKEKPKK